jgi:hypothetical protein
MNELFFAWKRAKQLTETVDLVRGEMTSLHRKTVSALVVMDVHARDVVAGMAAKGTSSEGDFEWLSQLRTYFESDGGDGGGGGGGGGDPPPSETVIARMMNASIEYGFEYLGNSSRLVITPLTDRCYRTLMGAGAGTFALFGLFAAEPSAIYAPYAGSVLLNGGSAAWNDLGAAACRAFRGPSKAEEEPEKAKRERRGWRFWRKKPVDGDGGGK